MKEVILDTDIGGDCDDAGALLILKSFHKQGAIRLLAVTSCTTMEGAEHCIYSILKDYGITDIPIGVNKGESFLERENMFRYAPTIKREFPCEPSTQEAVALLRKTLANAEKKVTFIAIGPQRNLINLLKSNPDNISPLNGEELVAQKVEELVLMAGIFAEETIYFRNSGKQDVEWNVMQDSKAADYVNRHWQTPIVYSPFELGHEIFTGENMPEGQTAHRCYVLREEYEKESSGIDRQTFTRESWDPIAAYYGAIGCNGVFTRSEYGLVNFDKDGYTTFTPDSFSPKAKHRVLRSAVANEAIEEALNKFMQ